LITSVTGVAYYANGNDIRRHIGAGVKCRALKQLSSFGDSNSNKSVVISNSGTAPEIALHCNNLQKFYFP